MTEDDVVSEILEREGGFVDNPADPGGATKFGITIPALADYRGVSVRGVTRQDIVDLGVNEAREIILKTRLAPWQGVDTVEMRWLLADLATHHGFMGAVRLIQGALGGLKIDGVLGPKTLAALKERPWKAAFLSICAQRERFFGKLISGSKIDRDHDGMPDNAEMAAGWADRNADFVDFIAKGLRKDS